MLESARNTKPSRQGHKQEELIFPACQGGRREACPSGAKAVAAHPSSFPGPWLFVLSLGTSWSQDGCWSLTFSRQKESKKGKPENMGFFFFFFSFKQESKHFLRNSLSDLNVRLTCGCGGGWEIWGQAKERGEGRVPL